MTEIKEKITVTELPITALRPFEEHPYKVVDNEEMASLVESIYTQGILTPITVRPLDNGEYEIVSGHRRLFACQKLGITAIPAIVKELSREDAILEMVDSNLHREHILPSEKAKAYKMKMDAMKRKAGRPSKENSAPLEQNFGKTTRDMLAADSPDSSEQIRRYVRLTELTPELLEFVDEGKIGMRPAVELSYLQEDEMRDLVDYIDTEGTFPSHAQTIRMRALSKEGKLDTDAINTIMNEEKPNQKARIKIPMEKIEKYFPVGTSEQKIEETIIKALALYRQRQKENRDAR